MFTMLKKLGARNASIVISGDPAKAATPEFIANLKARAEKAGYIVSVSNSTTEQTATFCVSARKADK